jgi:hypothetical protein
MNRTSKRITEYPFQPLRRNDGRFSSTRTPPQSDLPFRAVASYVGQGGIWIDSEALAVIFYKAAAVAKLGLPSSHGPLFN